MQLTNRQIGELARELGHEHLELESFGQGTVKGTRWVLRCSCGWHSMNFVLVDAAVSAGKTHLRNSIGDHLRNGRRVLPGSVGGRL